MIKEIEVDLKYIYFKKLDVYLTKEDNYTSKIYF